VSEPDIDSSDAAKTPVERVPEATAQQELLEHLRKVEPIVVGTWTREELYERE
jgi:hypothetical protein